MAKRGRPASFDREEALRRAMEVFWEVGYESATMSQLKAAMGGLCSPSVYAAFHSKEALFREAVELYRTEARHLGRDALNAPTARGAIENMLRSAVISYSSQGKPRGCLVNLGVMNCSPESRGVQDFLRACRQEAVEVIRARLRRAVEEGELAPEVEVEALAVFYTTVLQGLSTQAHDGASREVLMAIVDCAMSAWDQRTSPPLPPRP
ncbi:TetR/AcrR family transcriptional regulator [Vitiosangium sp. GDMCC 1.1324]|uniref:TetR/AcrR family transcriptional regulator n=1 Tax=Vitiosangium sp. (strain GDMCC 1.1324) TaxID=2138576 RepID=UPI000D3C7602|nr:TetR/AcrR family transcriptional regulator [Vitiosangium sp. GDMCC 1.1324]PTL82812.1 TetR family transcriptional regulator [Vitiosangium sp. GDMCC 1.1324]